MRQILLLNCGFLFVWSSSVPLFAEEPAAEQASNAEPADDEPASDLTEEEREKVELLFAKANRLMAEKNPAEALPVFGEALKILPEDPALLFNGGMAAYQTRDYETAVDCWKSLKEVDPHDWQARGKLIQAYQAMKKPKERDTEREELFALRKSGKMAALKMMPHFCRDQFEVRSRQVGVFELFELEGDHAMRYVFVVMNEDGDAEEFRISLGSYKFTNDVWRQLHNRKPGDRVFHLDGYFNNGQHVTYAMLSPEPSYDDVRERVVKILEDQLAKPEPDEIKPDKSDGETEK